MKNAHERFGVLEYTKRMKDTTTRIRLRLDRFIGEVEDDRNGKAHLISVLGGEVHDSIRSPLAWVKTPNASAGLSLSPAANQSATWSRSRRNWPRHDREQIHKAGEPSCATTTRRLCCIASRNGLGCRSSRSGPRGSTMNSTAVERSNRLSAWDALRCWSSVRRSCS